ncbi:4Fe-4S binding protein [bacterium]
MRTREKIFVLFVFLTILAAWFGGKFRQRMDLNPFFIQVLPQSNRFDLLSNGIYQGVVTDPSEERVDGYVTVGEAMGYGGPLRTAVGLDITGTILGIAVVDHKETISFFQKVLRRDVISSIIGKKYSDPLIPGEDIEAVTGATRTTTALVMSVSRAGKAIAGRTLGLPVKSEPQKPFRFGVPEIVLMGLFSIGFLAYGKRIRHKKAIRWISLILGLLVLGFIYSIPITLVNINALLLGFWPDWQTHFYWFLLLAGILLPMVILGKSPYCTHFCPFGAAQECLGAIGGVKKRLSSPIRHRLRWLQRFLAWAALLLALVYRNPSHFSYEVFGTLFNLTGSTFQFGLLAIVLVAALFISRPWCDYLCPVRAVTDYIKMVREWIVTYQSSKDPLKEDLANVR